jgi:hypothetical protein
MTKYKIPDEVKKEFSSYCAMLILREHYAEKRFGYKKAKKCAIEAEWHRQKFWHMVDGIYPDHKPLQYEKDKGYLTEIPRPKPKPMKKKNKPKK